MQQYGDRVTESTTTTGTGTITLAGALTGYQTISKICATGDTIYYSLWSVDGSGNPSGPWETGLGTYTSSGNTLARTTVIASSNSGSLVTLVGTSYVACAPLASKELHIGPDNGIQIPAPVSISPAIPPANTLQFFGRNIATRCLMGQIDPTDAVTAYQPILARNKIAYWNPAGNSTTTPGIFGLAALSLSGTATSRNVAITNLATRMRRIGYPSSSTAGTFSGLRMGVVQFSCGSGASPDDGSGFFLVERFVEADPAVVSGRREFFGMNISTSAPTNVEPNTLTNVVGVCQLSTDATQYYWYAAGSTAQTAVAIGTSIGAPAGSSTTAWELVIYCPQSVANTFYLQLTNLSTGVVANTSFTGGATVVPQSTTLLAWQHWATNNATAAVVGVDLCSVYIETSN